MIFHYQKLRKLMLDLINSLENILPRVDIENALEMVEYNEFGVGYEIVCEQLYEYEIKISSDIYQKIVEIGQTMEMKESKWIFLRKLINND